VDYYLKLDFDTDQPKQIVVGNLLPPPCLYIQTNSLGPRPWFGHLGDQDRPRVIT